MYPTRVIVGVSLLILTLGAHWQINSRLQARALSDNFLRALKNHSLNAQTMSSILAKHPERANAKTCAGFTPLHLVILSKRTAADKQVLVRMLLNHGANPDSRIDGHAGCYEHESPVKDAREYMNTPLHDAIRTGQGEITRLLLREGARLDITNLWESKPLDKLTCAATHNLIWPLLQNVRVSSRKAVVTQLMSFTEKCKQKDLTNKLSQLNSFLKLQPPEQLRRWNSLIADEMSQATPRN